MTRVIIPAALPPAPRPGPPVRPHRHPRPRLSPDLVAELAGRLTPRDRWLLAMIAEHQVLTSHQITQLAYSAPGTARHRMLQLWRLRAVDRIQPFTPTGSAPMHYVLGDAGAAILAAARGLTPAEAGYRREKTLAIFASPQLAHTTGTNGVMTALAAAARTRPGTALLAWWPERRCEHQWGRHARPDAYGRWRDGDTGTDFFLEYDTGTEPVARVTAKLGGYAALAAATGITTPVLFWFPTPAREASVRAALTAPGVPVATATPAAGPGPAGSVWLPACGDGRRVRIAALAIPPATRHPAAPAGPSTGRDQPPPLPGAPVPPMPPEEEPPHVPPRSRTTAQPLHPRRPRGTASAALPGLDPPERQSQTGTSKRPRARTTMVGHRRLRCLRPSRARHRHVAHPDASPGTRSPRRTS